MYIGHHTSTMLNFIDRFCVAGGVVLFCLIPLGYDLLVSLYIPDAYMCCFLLIRKGGRETMKNDWLTNFMSLLAKNVLLGASLSMIPFRKWKGNSPCGLWLELQILYSCFLLP